MTSHHDGCVSTYVASALSLLAGTKVVLSDERGPPRSDRFDLRGVPEYVDLGAVSEHVAGYNGFDRSMVESSSSFGKDNYTSTLYSGGRSRIPHSTVTVSRADDRILVDITALMR